MSNYKWLSNGQHMITVRDRKNNAAKQYRYWGEKVISKVLAQQKPTEDVYITKYPKNCLVETIILDFDNTDIEQAYKDVNKMRNYLTRKGHNCVIVKSGSKGYHLYIQIAPFLFKDTEYRQVSDWRGFFNAFTCFLIHDGVKTHYESLDQVNFSAGLNGNIRLIGSTHPKTQAKCEIIEGEFIDDQSITTVQDEAQKTAYHKLLIKKEDNERILKQTKVAGGDNPIENNDLRIIFEQITGKPVKHYPKGYSYGYCPHHGDSHPSLLITPKWFSCSADCGFKGNVFTLKKLGYVKFDDEGKVIF